MATAHSARGKPWPDNDEPQSSDLGRHSTCDLGMSSSDCQSLPFVLCSKIANGGATMSLLNQSVQVYGKIGGLFETLRQGQAPDKFTREFLKDIGFTSSNDHAFIPLLKGLGFVSADGSPTQRYRDFLDQTRWKKILAEAVREAYGDIFILKSQPSKSDEKMIAGKYKSTYNLSDIGAERAARTFLSLLSLADQDTLYRSDSKVIPDPKVEEPVVPSKDPPISPAGAAIVPQPIPIGLNYNIQIHLPATKDIEVYNAIFKSLKEHVIG